MSIEFIHLLDERLNNVAGAYNLGLQAAFDNGRKMAGLALDLIQCVPMSAAILDVKIGGHDCSSICSALSKRSIPFMFYTGYSNAAPLSAWPRAPALSKPAHGGTMVDAVAQLLPPSEANRI